MTDEIAELVLRDNYAQNLALACAEAEARSMLHVDAAYIDALEKSGELVRALERLPDAEGMSERRAAGLGLTRPELAVLLAYAKLTATHDITSSDIADDIFAQAVLVEYFPTALRERFAASMAEHPLLREIIATQLANQLVNFSGATFAARIGGETTASTAELIRAHTATRQVFDADALWLAIERLDDVVPSEVQTELLLCVRQLLDRGTRWFLTNRRPPLDVPETVAQLQPGVQAVSSRLSGSLRGAEAEGFAARVESLVGRGVPDDVARGAAATGSVLDTLSIVDIALRTQAGVDEVTDVHFALADSLGLSRLAMLISGLPRDSRWHTLARTAARDDLQAAHAELTTDVLLSTPSSAAAEERISLWQQVNPAALTRAGAVVDDIISSDTADLATLSVALREVRALVRAASLPSR